MRVRRTSGEIIALTMMEVFLTFLFVVLTFTTIREDQTRRLREDVERLRLGAGQLQTENEVLKRERDAARRQAEALERRFMSEFAPRCPQKARFLIDVFLHGGNRLEVLFNQDMYDGKYRRGQRQWMSRADFREYFGPLYQASVRDGCRYTAVMRDTPTISKTELLEMQSFVREFFYAEVRRPRAGVPRPDTN